MAFAKTTRPAVRGALMRRRLHRLLGRRGAKPLTWVWGPPGAGKTTLVASFVAARRCRTIWYQVDAGDADVATFFYYLGNAAPRRHAALPVLTPEYRAGLGLFARRYFRELYRRLRPPFALVMDNYQAVPADALLHDVLRDAVEELPKGGRLIVVSRTGPTSALARLQVHQAFDVIDWTQLRLTIAETRELARRFAGRGVSPADVRRLHELTDGWMAGLVLLFTQRDQRVNTASSESPQILFDYFAGEIFSRTTARARDVLMQTAFLPAVRPSMAVELTGWRDASAVIAELHRANYFTNKRAGADGAYQYHPLYREFLLAQARRAFAPARLAEIRSTAARLVEADGEVEVAADLLREAENWDALAALICRCAPVLLAQGRFETVEQWLAAMPDAVFARMAWALCWRGVCQLGRDHEACRRDCEQALVTLRRQRDVDGALLSWSTIVTSLLMEGSVRPLDTWIPLLDQLLNEMPGAPSEHIEARVAAAMLLAIIYRQPAHPDGSRWADRALASTRRNPDSILGGVAACGWVFYHWLFGDASKASLVVDDMRTLSRRRDVPSVVALHGALAVAWHEFFSALPSCRRTVADIRQHARATGLEHALTTTALTWGAFAVLTDGDLDVASGWIRELGSESVRFGPVYAFAYQVLVVQEALARNDLDRAKMYLDELAKQGFTTGFPFEEVVGPATAAYVLCARGDNGEAQAHAQRALTAARSIGSQFGEWIARLAEAHVCFAGGRDGEGRHALGIAMALGKAGGYVNSQVWIPRAMAQLCARALDAGIEVDYVRNLIRRRRLVCSPTPVDVEAWPWPVKITVFGRFAVRIADQPLAWTGKVPRKPLALLKVLISHGPSEVPEGTLIDVLWPRAEVDAARRALTTAVFRLRRLLGEEAAIVRGDGHIRIDMACCWVDLWAVERMLDRGEAITERSEHSMGETARWAERAAALYCGRLVGADSDEAWSEARDDRIRRRLLRQLARIGRHWEAADEWQRAADIFEAALNFDPCAEDVCRSLMVAYHRLGRPADVHAVYQRCCRTLESQVGVRPSPATEGLLMSLSFK